MRDHAEWKVNNYLHKLQAWRQGRQIWKALR